MLGHRGLEERAAAARALDDQHWANAALVVRAGCALEGLDMLQREATRAVPTVTGAEREFERGVRQASGSWAAGILRLRVGLKPVQPPHLRRPQVDDHGDAALDLLCDERRCATLAGELRALASECFHSSGPAWLRAMGLQRMRGQQATLADARRCLWSAQQLPLPDGRPVGAVRLELSERAMREFIAAHRAAPGWRGLRFANLLLDEQAFSLEASVDGLLEGHPFRWLVSTPLGRTRARTTDGLRKALAGPLEALGLSDPEHEPIGESIRLDFLSGRGPVRDDADPATAEAGGDARRLALVPNCRHERAAWQGVVVWSRLWCPDCESELACVPCHRMGTGRESRNVPSDARGSEFMELGDILASVEGRSVPRTFHDIPGFGDAPPLDPGDYASGVATAARSGSLAQALGARRR